LGQGHKPNFSFPPENDLGAIEYYHPQSPYMPGMQWMSTAKGMIKKACHESLQRVRPAWPQPFCDARSVYSVREHDKMATYRRKSASAKAGKAASGFFQHSHLLNLTSTRHPGHIAETREIALHEKSYSNLP